MPDIIQFAIVTLVAGAALAAIVRPYVARRTGSDACAACPSASRRPRQPAAAANRPAAQPLRVIRR